MKVLKVTEYEYQELCDDNMGFCTKCGKLNDGYHEPDAQNYECDHCGSESSQGLSDCLISGNLVIVDEEEDSNL